MQAVFNLVLFLIIWVQSLFSLPQESTLSYHLKYFSANQLQISLVYHICMSCIILIMLESKHDFSSRVSCDIKGIKALSSGCSRFDGCINTGLVTSMKNIIVAYERNIMNSHRSTKCSLFIAWIAPL